MKYGILKKLNHFFVLLRKVLRPRKQLAFYKNIPKTTQNLLPTTMMLARSANMATTAKAVAKRVTFKNDHPNLMKPRATDKFIFAKNSFVSEFVHEKVEPVTNQRPRRLRFGRSRSLAEMAGEAPEKKARSLSVTIEEVNPERILRNKSPACPLYTPMTAYSNGRKMWKQAELDALKGASTKYYKLICKRADLVKEVYQNPAGNRNSEIADKVSEITDQIAVIKSEMDMHRRNILSMEAF